MGDTQTARKFTLGVDQPIGAGHKYNVTSHIGIDLCGIRSLSMKGFDVPHSFNNISMQEKNGYLFPAVPRSFQISTFAIISFSIFAILMLAFFNRLRVEQQNDSVRMEALMDVKVNLSNAHLWLEEYLTKNNKVYSNKAFYYLEGAKKETEVMLGGGVTGRGERLETLHVPRLNERQKVFLSLINKFIDLASQRAANPEESGVGTPIDGKFEHLYRELLSVADDVEFILEEREARLLVQFRYVFWGILFFWVSAVLVSITVIFFMERRRSQLMHERSTALAEKRESEIRASMAQKAGNVGIWDWNPNSGELVCSDEIYSVLGFGSTEILLSYELFMEMLHPDDKEFVARSLEMALYQKKPYQVECRVESVNGEECIAEMTGEVKFDDDGRPVRMIGTFIDITKRKLIESELLQYRDHLEALVKERTLKLNLEIEEHKKSEEKLQKSEGRYRSLIEATTSILWTTDKSGGFTVPQLSWEKFTGQPWSEHKGFGWTKMIHPDDITRLLETWKKACSELSLYRSYGRIWSDALKEYRHFEVSAVPIKKPDGSLREWVGVIEDISKRKLAEEAQQQSEEKFRALVENIPGISYRCALDEHWTMEFISTEVEEITGYPASDFLNNQKRSYASIIHPEDVVMVDEVVRKHLNQKEPFTIEYRIVKSDGELRWVFEKGQGIFNVKEVPLWLDGVILDITERKMANKGREELHD